MKYEIGDRLKIDDAYCTLRYVGSLPIWPSSIAYGVEWDDPYRGKNCGSFRGKVYFRTASSFGGSFIKESCFVQKAAIGVSFFNAIIDKYRPSSVEMYGMSLGTKPLVTVGLAKLDRKHSNLRAFTRLSLSSCLINDNLTSTEELSSIKELFPRVTNMDLSYNLLCNFENTCQLLECLPNLTFLDLSGNRFSKGLPLSKQFCFRNVKCLYLVGCGLDNGQLNQLLKIFPSIETLDISKNNHLNFEIEPTRFPSSLKELNASFNDLVALSPNMCLDNIENLNVSNNKMREINAVYSRRMRSIDVSCNQIDHWECIDQLNLNFPSLYAVRVNGNPVTSSDTLSDFYQVIARFNGVQQVNGSLLSEDARREAELYFMSKLRDGEIQFNQKLDRFKYLSQIYKTNPVSAKRHTSALDTAILSLKVVCKNTDVSHTIILLSTCTVRYLKTVCSRKFQVDSFRICLYRRISAEVLDKIDSDFYALSHFNISDGDLLILEQE